jgi:hypothetical protein
MRPPVVEPTGPWRGQHVMGALSTEGGPSLPTAGGRPSPSFEGRSEDGVMSDATVTKGDLDSVVAFVVDAINMNS